jgi:peptide-methionine (R)-S-oxide reductase
MRERSVRSEADWKDILTPEQFSVTRRKGTEPAYSGKYCDFPGVGVYRCVCCGNALFSSETKFEMRSRLKWPIFREPVAYENIRIGRDTQHFILRHEVRCACCDAHLGYRCQDGRFSVGKWYFINSCALAFLGSRGRALHAFPVLTVPEPSSRFAVTGAASPA